MALLPAPRRKEVFISAAGGPEVLQLRDGPIPQPRAHEVLIAVHFAGVNRHDCNQRRRGPTSAHVDVPGLEVSGVVAAVGSQVQGFAIGDRVCALTDGGGYASFSVADAEHTFALAQSVTDADAAALPEALFTAWHNFFGVADLRAGESVLVHGGTSGVGSIAIQLLARLGHPVYATCGTSEKCALARKLGAREAFNYQSEDFVARTHEVTGGRGVDVILDMAGIRYGAQNIEALAYRGRVVHLAPGDGTNYSAPLRAIMAKEAKVTGSLLRPLPTHEKAAIARKLKQIVWPLIDAGAIVPQVQGIYPLSQAAFVHRSLESGETMGKLLLRIEQQPDLMEVQ